MNTTLLEFDSFLFLTINHLPHNPFLNTIGSIFSAGSGVIWFLLFAGILFVLDRKRRLLDRDRFVPMLSILWATVVTHVVVILVFKSFVARPRPDLTHESTVTVVNYADSLIPVIRVAQNEFAFPSGHATIAFASAYILTRAYPRFAWWLYTVAALIAFSRVYLGKHYMSDVVAGAGIGVVIGYFALASIRLLLAKAKKTPHGLQFRNQ
jgi:undecaprenyl-diphosphatase